MSRKKRIVSSIISCFFAVQILTSSVFNPFGVSKAEAANQEYNGEILSSKAVLEDIVPQAEEKNILTTESCLIDDNKSEAVNEKTIESKNNQGETTDQIINPLIVENDAKVEQNANSMNYEQLENDDMMSSSDSLLDFNGSDSSISNDKMDTDIEWDINDIADEMQPIEFQETDALYEDENVIPTIDEMSTTILAEDTEKPSTPQNLVAEATDKKITLTWEAATDNIGVAGYNVYRNNELIGTTYVATFVDDNNGEGLVPGEEYEYSVEAFDEAGNCSDKVSIKVATLLNEISSFKVIENILNEDGTASITIAWNKVNNAKKYVVCVDDIFTYNVSKEFSSFTHRDLIKNTQHSYKVYVEYLNGKKSAWSETIRVISAPQKPIEVNAELDSSDLACAEIIWKAVDGASKYQVLLNGANYAVVEALPREEISYFINGLSTNRDYLCEIIALDSNNNDMGNSGRILINTGEATITKSEVLYENRVYGNLIIKAGTIALGMNDYKITVKGNCTVEKGTIDFSEGELKIEGNCIFKGGNLRLNRCRLTVEGDLIHSNGNIYVGKGEILIKGNYNATNSGIMYMENEEDYVCVEGDFYIATTSHKNNWIAGVLEVKGDFTQERNPSNGGNVSNFVYHNLCNPSLASKF